VVNAPDPSHITATINGTPVGGTFAIAPTGHVIIRGFDGANNITLTGAVWGEIYGGNGADIITGGDGNDVIYGGNGADGITGGLGQNVIHGGNGPDTVVESGDFNFVLTNSVLSFGPTS